MWNDSEKKAFLSNFEQLGVKYPELSDVERRAYEDAFGGILYVRLTYVLI